MTTLGIAALILIAETMVPAGGGPETRPAERKPRAVLRVGMNPRTAPAAFLPGVDLSREDQRRTPALTTAQLARIEGSDVDVMKALARRLGVEPIVVPTTWFDLESGLLAGRFDLILNCWTPHENTPPGILASAPYYEWGLLVAVRANDTRIRTFNDLRGRKLGHMVDPTVERSLREMRKGLEVRGVVVRDSGSQLFDDLGAGVTDALIFDSLYVRWRVARDPSFRVVGRPLNRLGYHVGVRERDKELLEKINAAIRGFLVSGEMAAIRRKWEGG